MNFEKLKKNDFLIRININNRFVNIYFRLQFLMNRLVFIYIYIYVVYIV